MGLVGIIGPSRVSQGITGVIDGIVLCIIKL